MIVAGLSIWTVYDHPSDYPDCFIARRFCGETPTDNVICSTDLLAVRAELIVRGLTVVCRDPADDPNILEVWL